MESEPLPQLTARLQALCLERGVTLVTAESCTGGLVAKLITDVPGSSGYFRGGIVAYADETKGLLLDVSAELIAAHGAVSAQVARAMAQGACARTRASIAVAVTGVSGPGGGTAAKPVGLTYVAVAHFGGVEVRRHMWTGDRAANREATARAALELLLECVTMASAAAGPA
jgi:nicotinamide-nucleotide amidase